MSIPQESCPQGRQRKALTWSITGRARSIVTNTFIFWTLLCVAANIGITQVIHVAGEDNKNCHLLSRNGPHLTVTVEEEARSVGIEGARTVEVNGEESVKKILRLFDPQRVLTTEEDFIRFWPEEIGRAHV